MTTQVSTLIGLRRRAKREGWAQWIKSELDERAVLEGYFFDVQKSERPILFFQNFLRHFKGKFKGKIFDPLPWQRDELLQPLYGWQRPDGTRRFRRVYCAVPKKNGKSTLCAGIELFSLIADNEPGAQVYSAATDREQASVVHNVAASMVRMSPALDEILRVVDSRKRIVFDTTAWIQALSAEFRSKEGVDSHTIVVDELHAWPNRKLFDALIFAGRARTQPLFVVITTFGEDYEGIWGEEHLFAESVLKGETLDLELLPIIYAASPDADWTSEETLAAANPSYGVLFGRADYETDIIKAKSTPQTEARYKRYMLNMLASTETAYLPAEHWKECKQPVSEEELEESGRECWAGLDLSSVNDLTAWALCFPREDGAGFDALVRHWIPQARIKTLVEKGIGRFNEWADKGHVSAIEGETIDEDVVLDAIFEDCARFNVQSIRFDRWGSRRIARLLDGKGLKLKPFGQGFKDQSGPTKELLRLVTDHEIAVDNDCLDWQAGHATVVEDRKAENVQIVKRSDLRGKYKKVDGLIALVMALDGAAFGDDDDEPLTADSISFVGG